MSSRVRLLATILGIAGLTCAVWPRGDFHIGLGGPGEWGIGWPVPWFVYTYTPLGWHFGTEFARLSAAFGFLGLLCLLCVVTPRPKVDSDPARIPAVNPGK